MPVYLNNAATTWPKPQEVANAMSEFLSQGGANLARGSSSSRDMNTLNLVLDCRMKLAELFGGYENCDPRYVTLCSGVTEALNIVLQGFLKNGMKVLTSSMEHNAVMRPLRRLETNGVHIKIAPSYSDGIIDLEAFKRILTVDKYDLIVLSHASNVCGTIQPLRELAEICRERDVPLVVDSAQTAGVIEINASELGISALCFTGHKGLFGSQGTGGIVWNPEFANRVEPLITGGTGSYSHLEIQPEELPDRFEAGTPNLPGIAGLNAALDWLKTEGIENISRRESELGKYFLERLIAIEGIELTGRHDMQHRLSVFSFNIKDKDNGVLADELSRAGFDTRPGLHCSPAAHKALGTYPNGSLRVSLGYFNTFSEIDSFFETLRLYLVA